MKRLQEFLVCLLLASLIALVIFTSIFIHQTSTVEAAIPGEIQATRAALVEEIAATRMDLTRQIAAARRDAIALAGSQLTAVRTEALALVDRRTGDALTRIDTAIAASDMRLGEIAGTAAALEADVKPVVANTAALMADVQASLDDNYYDVKAIIASSTVAVTGVARAAEAVGNAAPAMTASIAGIEKNFDGITADVHTETTEFTRPKTFWEKVRMWAQIGAEWAIRIL